MFPERLAKMNEEYKNQEYPSLENTKNEIKQ